MSLRRRSSPQQPMIWHLLPHVTACVASGQIILLDVRQDRYFAVPEIHAAEVRAWLEGVEPVAAPTALAALFRDNGLVRPGDPEIGKVEIANPTAPRDSAITAAHPSSLAAADHLSLASNLVGTWLSLRLRPLHILLARAGGRAAGNARQNQNLAARAAAFSRARRLFPIPRNCLLDSLTLDRWLGGEGTGRVLVLGVAAHPFAAHCWLQSDGMVLNDSFDRVSRYAPILVL